MIQGRKSCRKGGCAWLGMSHLHGGSVESNGGEWDQLGSVVESCVEDDVGTAKCELLVGKRGTGNFLVGVARRPFFAEVMPMRGGGMRGAVGSISTVPYAHIYILTHFGSKRPVVGVSRQSTSSKATTERQGPKLFLDSKRRVLQLRHDGSTR